MEPLVSVIIPAYNKSQLTVKTVDSVLAQTYRNIEIIVVDDGSTDDTGLLLGAFTDKIKYVYKKNGGACSARNLGLRQAGGAYISFLDCDDLYEPQKIQRCVEYLEKNGRFGFVHTAAYFIDEKDQVIGTYDHPKSQRTGLVASELIMGNFICNSTAVIRKRCLDKVGGFDETIFPPADWDLWLRLSERFEVGYLDQPLTKYRVTDNYTFRYLERSKADEQKVVEKFFARNRQWTDLAGKAWSRFHFRYAQCYLLKDDSKHFQQEFLLAFKRNPLNGKAWLMLAYFFIAKENLKAQLRNKILRYPPQAQKLSFGLTGL